jgi:peroxiredoxin
MLRLLVLALSLLCPVPALAMFQAPAATADDPVAVKLDEPCPDWKDLPGVDGRKWSLADFRDKSVLVLCFTCNACPYSIDYEDRLLAFAKKYADHPAGVALVAINANRKPSETLEKMQERAKQKGLTFPYIADESQQLAAACGAVYTPEFLVFNHERKLVYRGAMDDKTKATEVTVRHLENAVEATLRKQLPEVRNVPARGCAIPYRRSRR